MFAVAILIPILFIHIRNIPKVEDYAKNSTNASDPVFMLVNACSIGDYVLFVFIVGSLVLVFLNAHYIGLVDWTDKLLSMVLALAANVEGIHLYIRHLVRSNNREEQKLSFHFFDFFLLGFSFHLRSSLNFYLVFLFDFLFTKIF